MNAMVGRFLTAMLFLGSFANKYATAQPSLRARQKAAVSRSEDVGAIFAMHALCGAGSTRNTCTLLSHPGATRGHPAIAPC